MTIYEDITKRMEQETVNWNTFYCSHLKDAGLSPEEANALTSLILEYIDEADKKMMGYLKKPRFALANARRDLRNKVTELVEKVKKKSKNEQQQEQNLQEMNAQQRNQGLQAIWKLLFHGVNQGRYKALKDLLPNENVEVSKGYIEQTIGNEVIDTSPKMDHALSLLERVIQTKEYLELGKKSSLLLEELKKTEQPNGTVPAWVIMAMKSARVSPEENALKKAVTLEMLCKLLTRPDAKNFHTCLPTIGLEIAQQAYTEVSTFKELLNVLLNKVAQE